MLAALGLITHAEAIAAEAMPGFDAKTFAEAVKAIGGPGAESKEINLTAPEIAENGAVVPLVGGQCDSRIPQAIYVFVEKNPNPLSAAFMIPAGTDPSVTTRVKMGESSRITAVVKAGGKLYTTSRETKVTPRRLRRLNVAQADYPHFKNQTRKRHGRPNENPRRRQRRRGFFHWVCHGASLSDFLNWICTRARSAAAAAQRDLGFTQVVYSLPPALTTAVMGEGSPILTRVVTLGWSRPGS